MEEEEEEEEEKKVWALCGLGYWVQGFRCFPWLALNFHMVHGLRLSPSTLQLVQSSANLPLVAKPLFGVISDAIYIGGAHRIPYISIGVFLQIIAWGALALIPATGETFPAQMACILLTNLGASLTEVVSDALTAEFSRAQYAGKLQSYALIALAAGAIFGNLSGGFILLKAQDPKLMFFMFVLLLTVQFVLSLTTKETSLYPTQCSSHHLVQNSLPENLSRQFSELMTAISEERIYYPLLWIVASIAVVPILSVGGLIATILYNRYLKKNTDEEIDFWGADGVWSCSSIRPGSSKANQPQTWNIK
ncbi:hypothetical protein J5N97_024302 [Dioscorea zingiberensis]|uniref:Uncharacterized protein n=1 Tax=Dioscorea zingiberensis TaxID=325984 RepID=A0A9D5C6P6_9LILI|nr:hypothetical protein J5N97_024302 [Dioscorea zingiberensis]